MFSPVWLSSISSNGPSARCATALAMVVLTFRKFPRWDFRICRLAFTSDSELILAIKHAPRDVQRWHVRIGRLRHIYLHLRKRFNGGEWMNRAYSRWVKVSATLSYLKAIASGREACFLPFRTRRRVFTQVQVLCAFHYTTILHCYCLLLLLDGYHISKCLGQTYYSDAILQCNPSSSKQCLIIAWIYLEGSASWSKFVFRSTNQFIRQYKHTCSKKSSWLGDAMNMVADGWDFKFR